MTGWQAIAALPPSDPGGDRVLIPRLASPKTGEIGWQQPGISSD
jgi:hypothetical protein